MRMRVQSDGGGIAGGPAVTENTLISLARARAETFFWVNCVNCVFHTRKPLILLAFAPHKGLWWGAVYDCVNCVFCTLFLS